MRPRCFIDFDRTIFDTDYANTFLEDAMRLLGKERVESTYAALKSSTFSIERLVTDLQLPAQNIDHYKQSVKEHSRLYANAAATLRRIAETHDLILVTYGDFHYQMFKLNTVLHLLPTFQGIHVIQNTQTKGEIVKLHGLCPGDIFVDDLPQHLLNVRMSAPWVKLFRPMHPNSRTATPHEYDETTWTTFTEFSEHTITPVL